MRRVAHESSYLGPWAAQKRPVLTQCSKVMQASERGVRPRGAVRCKASGSQGPADMSGATGCWQIGHTHSVSVEHRSMSNYGVRQLASVY